MKNPEDRRIHEIKVRFSDRELERARLVESEFGICRAEVLRNIYMEKINDLIARLNNSSTAA